LGLAAAAHLYGAFGGVTFADLNGPQFLADDPVADDFEVPAGAVRVPTGPGIGVTIDPEKLERYSSIA
jgi:muconate cycloisomerase